MRAVSKLIKAARVLTDELRDLEFPAPVAYTYLPLEYAWKPHEDYLKKFGSGKKRVLFLGMNPGPFGMAQTGVPFGEIAAVKDWMGIQGEVGKPAHEHPKRPIEGFACQRSEVSGRRLWGLFQDRFGTADAFFEDHFVTNYCPLVWMSATGANLTPDKIAAASMVEVEGACLRHLASTILALQPEFLIGVGAFAEQRIRTAAETVGSKASIGKVLHPSPASPAANRGWAEAATKQLLAQGVWA
ncbi:single-stranded DNA-binding protein [Luteolibacter pohnpeiensis]|uniref:Single-stranded DNA-binding protein n=1 Tax=Luteolibacter pohnpeiensis TaxID=454153 RepID=A0A934VXZ6_9BACT|nr:uracil-DNA glycosylase family protein [Luteolibacter pohnpeiensis]MBK1884014.1 single-stranded DNA-binding protein [Luteolibacter pohnpeiensis]